MQQIKIKKLNFMPFAWNPLLLQCLSYTNVVIDKLEAQHQSTTV